MANSLLGSIDREESIHLFANDSAQIHDPVSDWATIHSLHIIHVLSGNYCGTTLIMLVTALVKLVDRVFTNYLTIIPTF